MNLATLETKIATNLKAPRHISYRLFKINRGFGVEMEIERNQPQATIKKIINTASARPVQLSGGEWAQTPNDFPSWHVKKDSTCGPLGKGKDTGGWEVASFKGGTPKDLLEIAKVATALRHADIAVNDNCGVHVHADISDFDIKRAGIFLAWWCKFEHLIAEMLPAHRRSNKYCRLLHEFKQYDIEKSYTPTEFWELVRPQSLGIHENNDRRFAINMVNYTGAVLNNYPYKKTAELRLPEGTLNGSVISNWTRFYLLFVDACKVNDMPEDLTPILQPEKLLEFIGVHNQKSFVILSRALHRTKIWVLSRMTKYGKDEEIKSAALEMLNFCSITNI